MPKATPKHKVVTSTMPKATPKRKVVTLSKSEQLEKALKEFDRADQKFIEKLHDLRFERVATERERKFILDQKARDLLNWAKLYLNLRVKQPTLSRWINNRTYDDGPMLDTMENVKRRVSVSYPELEEKLTEWFDKYQHNVNMTGDLIRRKAERIRDRLEIRKDDLSFSGGWLDRFKKRHGIRQHRRYGESGDVDMALVESKRPEIQALLNQYPWSDIYNMDETSLFYQKEVSIS
jgi:broad-specificity NMP kinase